ncbi:MAG: hypothetical protein E6Q97_04795 [Desulfurellales bacterium]|nr:MAG: hypothetical protein E6Q97_04795 [Desulfurellales bacterium]
MNVDRPEMPIPQGAKDALALAQLGAGQSKMAGYDQAMSNIDRTLGTMSSSAGRVSTGSGQALEALTNASAIGMGQKTALDMQNAQDMERRREILRSELGHMAQWQKDKWAWDYQQKYLEDAATKSALIGSGIQNAAGAIEGAGSMFMAQGLYGDKMAPSPTALGAGAMTPTGAAPSFGAGAVAGSGINFNNMLQMGFSAMPPVYNPSTGAVPPTYTPQQFLPQGFNPWAITP